MKTPILFVIWLALAAPVHAQFFKKISDKVKGITSRKDDPDKKEEPTLPEQETIRSNTKRSALTIGGDESVNIDSSFEFDVAVYQESVAYQANQKVVDGGEQIVIYYSNNKPQTCIQLNSKATGARYHFYVDFANESQLSITAMNRIGSGEKEKLDLEQMEPVYPGEIGYLSQLTRTGAKKVIAGVACEEYAAQNNREGLQIARTSHAQVTAHVWIPMEAHTLFHGYGLMPEKYKLQIERMRREGSYPPVVFPLEMYLQYGNGDRIYTYTTDIITGEKWKVNIRDIIK